MKPVIETAVADVLAELGLEEVRFVVEHPADLEHGDYACNVAMAVAKQMGESPRAVAEKIVASLEDKIEYVEKIDIAGPGFINFHLTRDFFTAEVARINALASDWGKNESWSGKKVLVEYTDPNPFKEFHIGHLFTNTVGESIARLFMMNGAVTKRLNYQGDVGMHVACSIYGMKQLGLSIDNGFTAKDLGKAYALGASAYKNGEDTHEIKRINKAVYERNDEEINSLYDAGRKISLDYFETIYQTIDTKFDEYFFESEAGPKGKELVLSNPDTFTESDGAKVFVGEEYGLHTRVFLNSEGLPTYEAKELALAKMKEDRLGEYDHSIISTANEISEYFKVLLKAMSLVYPELADKTEHIGHGMVRLSTGKMSSRTGEVISATDFINEIKDSALEKMRENNRDGDEAVASDVAIAAIKYTTLKGSILQDTVFDKEQALSFEGSSGPYLQYTNARINSALEKAESLGVVVSTQVVPDAIYKVEKMVYQFEEVIEEALRERAPHKVVTFLTDLASEFNSFYAQEKIADPEDEFAPYKASLAKAVSQTLQNGLWVLGIKAPERM